MTNISFQKIIYPLPSKQEERLIDLHVHSEYSLDGFLTTDQLLRRAKRLGIGLAICDHNEIQGSREASHQKEIMIVPGIEVTVKSGTHLLFYFKNHSELENFFKEVVLPHKKNNPFVIDLCLPDLLEEAKQFECLIGSPHPFDLQKGGIQKALESGLLLESETEVIDLIEAVNGMASRKQNEKAINWARKMNKPTIGGSDGHLENQIGTVVTKVKGSAAEEVFENLKNSPSIMGKEATRLLKGYIEIKKELKLVLRKDGLKILTDQIQRGLRK